MTESQRKRLLWRRAKFMQGIAKQMFKEGVITYTDMLGIFDDADRVIQQIEEEKTPGE